MPLLGRGRHQLRGGMGQAGSKHQHHQVAEVTYHPRPGRLQEDPHVESSTRPCHKLQSSRPSLRPARQRLPSGGQTSPRPTRGALFTARKIPLVQVPTWKTPCEGKSPAKILVPEPRRLGTKYGHAARSNRPVRLNSTAGKNRRTSTRGLQADSHRLFDNGSACLVMRSTQ